MNKKLSKLLFWHNIDIQERIALKMPVHNFAQFLYLEFDLIRLIKNPFTIFADKF